MAFKLVGKVVLAAPQKTETKNDHRNDQRNDQKYQEDRTEKKRKSPQKDFYPDEFDPEVIPVDTNRDIKLSVRRQGEMGLPHIDMRVWAHTDLYTGFTKQGFSVPVEQIRDIVVALEKVERECHRRNLMYYGEEESEV